MFSVHDFDFSAYGSHGPNHHGFGQKDLWAAKDQGASLYQLYQLREKARRLGLNEGSLLAGHFNAMGPMPQSPWDFGAHGGWNFGMADINAIGGSLEERLKKAREYRAWGAQHGISVGPGAQQWFKDTADQIWQDKQDANQAALLAAQNEAALQQQQAQEQAALSAEAGRLASQRGGGNQTVQSGGAAQFKGKGLKSSENRRGKGRGTGQFKRAYSASGLSIATGSGKGNASKGVHNL